MKTITVLVHLKEYLQLKKIAAARGECHVINPESNGGLALSSGCSNCFLSNNGLVVV